MAESSDFRETLSKYIEWKIPKSHVFNPKSLRSPTFSLPGVTEKWFIRIFLYDVLRPKIRKFVFVAIFKERSSDRRCVDFRMGIKRVDGSEFKAVKRKTLFGMHEDSYTAALVDISYLKNSKDVIAPDGTLTVFCNATIVDGPVVSSAAVADISTVVTETLNDASQTPLSLSTVETASQTTSSNDNSILLEDFKNMYINECYTDVTIIVKNKKFCAHRSVLASRSPVFASMFQHELTEKISGKVEISDCDPDSFEDFLLFLYTGKLDVSSSKAVYLYRTADKYDMKELKDICIDIMHGSLCVDSFCDVIHLATMYYEADLLKAATEFFIENVESIYPLQNGTSFRKKIRY